MTKLFQVHTKESATVAGAEALARLQSAVGVVPNLAATMAESPELLNGFLDLRERYAKTGFTGAEVQILSLVAAYENRCAWCVAFHTAMALKEGVARASVDRLRAGQSPEDKKAGALADFARLMVQKRGHVGDVGLKAFLEAGHTKKQALDVVLGMGFSLLANYAGHLTNPALDAFLEPHAFQFNE
jgi:AhpD family alkylhydroperoxidase